MEMLEPSPQTLALGSSPADFPARTSHELTQTGKASRESDPAFGNSLPELFQNLAPSTSASKTCLTYSGKDLASFWKTWPISGMMRLGRSSTQSTLGSPKEGVEFTFWESVMESPEEPIYSTVLSVLDQPFPKELELSTNTMLGIVRRSIESGIKLPSLLDNALTSLLPKESLQRLRSETTRATQTSYFSRDLFGE